MRVISLPRLRSHRHRQKGVYLIEVLVAILILSVGMIGLLGLMLRSFAQSGSSYYRNTAVMETAWLADALRANVGAINQFVNTNPASATRASACFTTAGCPSSSMVGTLLKEWDNRLIATKLPSGTGTLCRGDYAAETCSSAASPSGVYYIRVCWTPGGADSLGGQECVKTQL